MDIAERRLPQDGRLRIVIDGGTRGDYRVSSLPTLFGESWCCGGSKPCRPTSHSPASASTRSRLPRWRPRYAPAWPRTRHGSDRQRQDAVALLRAADARSRRAQRLHGRGSRRDPARRHQPGRRRRKGRPRSRQPCARCCGRIRTSSWSARFAMRRRPTSRSRPRRPAISCCRRCTRTTHRPPSRDCSTSASRRTTSRPRCTSSPRNASSGGCTACRALGRTGARPARSRLRPGRPRNRMAAVRRARLSGLSRHRLSRPRRPASDDAGVVRAGGTHRRTGECWRTRAMRGGRRRAQSARRGARARP